MSDLSKSQVDNMGLSSHSQSPGFSPHNCNSNWVQPFRRNKV